MGILRNFDLSHFKMANCFLETGSENGLGIEHAAKYKNLLEIHSVEINEKFYNFCKQKFKFSDKVKLWLGSSEDRMSDMISSIEKYDSCIFWLDAHLPSDPGSRFLHDRVSNEIEFPLEAELKIIKENRDVSKDYFIIDDLRIYIEGPFQHTGQSWPHRHLYPDFFPHKDGIKFVEDLLGDTHDIVKVYDHEGYLLLYPKGEQ